MEQDSQPGSISGTSIAGQTLWPGESVVGTLLTSQDGFVVLVDHLAQAGNLPGEGHGFATNELKPVSAQLATRPITPEEGSRRR